MPKIIAFCGPSKSGKNHLANSLETFLEDKIRKPHPVAFLSFADPLKDFFLDWYNHNNDTNHDREWLEQNKEAYRNYLILIGASARAANEDHWVNQLIQYMYILESLTSPPSAYIITDLRFKNEAKKITELGGLVIKVEVSEETLLKRGSTRVGTPDPSETEWKNIHSHLTIRNEEGLDLTPIWEMIWATYVNI